MEPERASIFADENELDVSSFAPKPKSDAPRVDAEGLRAVAESRGFVSREAAAPPPAAPQPVSRPVPARVINFDTRLTIRVTDEAKRRFDDLTYRLRVPNGEAFNRLLDLFEASEKKS